MIALRTLAVYAAVALATAADLARPALARLRTAAELAVLAAAAAADAAVTFAWSLACGAARPGGLGAAVTSARYRAAYHLAETADRAADGQVTSLSVRAGPVLRVLGAPNPLGGDGHAE